MTNQPLTQETLLSVASAYLTEAVGHHLASAGEEVTDDHFENELNLISNVTLGSTLREIREATGHMEGPISLALHPAETCALAHMMLIGAALLDMGLPRDVRKEQLEHIFESRHQHLIRSRKGGLN